MKKLQLILLLCITNYILAQTPVYQFSASITGADKQLFLDTAIDSQGYIYVTGTFSNVTNFNPSGPQALFTSNGDLDIFVSKYSPNGTYLWTITMGGVNADFPRRIAIDNEDNFVITGILQESADFDPSPADENILTSNGLHDTFLAKYTKDGNHIWAFQIGGLRQDWGQAVVIDNENNIFLAGVMIDETDFDHSSGVAILNAGVQDAFIAKYNENGVYQWAKNMGSLEQSDQSLDIVLDVNGHIFLTGYFQLTADFDPSPAIFNLTSNGEEDGFLAKYDNDGNFLWALSIGGSGKDEVRRIVTDNVGSAYIIASFRGTVDTDPGAGQTLHTSLGEADVLLAKYSASGNLIWSKSIGGPTDNSARGIVLDSNDNIYISGSFTNSMTFIPSNTLNSAGMNDIFLAKYTSDGDFIHVHQLGGIGEDYCSNLSLYNDDDLYFMGSYTSVLDIDFSSAIINLPAADAEDTFIAKYNVNCFVPTAPIVNQAPTICYGSQAVLTTSGGNDGTLLWFDAPSGGTQLYSGGTFITPELTTNTTFYVVNRTCTFSSRTPITVIVNPFIDNTIVLSGNTLTANQGGAIYTWMDCNGTAIQGATSQNFTPQVSGNYKVKVQLGSCSKTSDCLQLTVLGNAEFELVKFTVVPNPTTGILTISSGFSGKATIQVSDLNGRIVYKNALNTFSNEQKIDLSNIQSGIYLLNITGENFNISRKVIKN